MYILLWEAVLTACGPTLNDALSLVTRITKVFDECIAELQITCYVAVMVIGLSGLNGAINKIKS